MRKFRGLISILMVLVLSLSLVGCGSKSSSKETETKNESKETSKTVMEKVSQRYTDAKDIKSVSGAVEFALNGNMDGTEYAVKGTLKIDSFTKPAQARIILSLEMNGEKMEYSLFVNEESLVFSLDGKTYSKLAMSELESMASDSLGTTGEETEATAAPEISKDTVEAITKAMVNFADEFKISGSKKVGGTDCYVIKGALTEDNLNQLIADLSTAAKDELASLEESAGDLSEAKVTFPEGCDSIDVELYVTKANYDFAGLHVDYAELVKAYTEADKLAENYIDITTGMNTAEEFKIPDAEETDLTSLMSLFMGGSY